MALNRGLILENVESSPLRAPLQTKAATVALEAPSQKQIRRKSSFVLRADSSDDFTSPHDSIFEALYISPDDSDESSNRIELDDVSPGVARKEVGVNDENTRDHKSFMDTYPDDGIDFRYGHGTPLETITEQRSCTTIRTLTRTKSADDALTIPFLTHRDSFVLARSPRRKMSFSLDDMTLINKSYHEACSLIEQTASKPSSVHEIYAQPKLPIQAPLERPPTPPGMPSWSAAQDLTPEQRQQASRNQSGIQNRFQRFFGLPVSGITLSSRVPATAASPRDRTASAPVGGRMAPRFRPPRSAYGPIDQHPFATAPFAQVSKSSDRHRPVAVVPSGSGAALKPPTRTGKRKVGQKVRFTPSATARDSELLSLQNAIESTTTSAMNPMSPMVVTLQTIQTQNQCPHLKGRPAVLKSRKFQATINHLESTPPSNEYRSLPSSRASRHDFPPTTQSPFSSLSRSLASSRRSTVQAGEFGIVDLGPSRTVSVSSTAHLMTGAFHPSPEFNMGRSQPHAISTNGPRLEAPKEKEVWCWRCQVGKAADMIDRWWMRSASCLCFVCCGYDIDDDVSIYHGSSGIRGGGLTREILGPRRVILQETLTVVL